jgi:hypothetical protein
MQGDVFKLEEERGACKKGWPIRSSRKILGCVQTAGRAAERLVALHVSCRRQQKCKCFFCVGTIRDLRDYPASREKYLQVKPDSKVTSNSGGGTDMDSKSKLASDFQLQRLKTKRSEGISKPLASRLESNIYLTKSS